MCSVCFHSSTPQFHIFTPPHDPLSIPLDNRVVWTKATRDIFFYSDLTHQCLDVTNYWCIFFSPWVLLCEILHIHWLNFVLPPLLLSTYVPSGFAGCPPPCQLCFIYINQNVSLSRILLKTKQDSAVHIQGPNFFIVNIDVQIGQSLNRRKSS